MFVTILNPSVGGSPIGVFDNTDRRWEIAAFGRNTVHTKYFFNNGDQTLTPVHAQSTGFVSSPRWIGIEVKCCN